MGVEDYRFPLQIAEGFLPVDMSVGANDGDWVNLTNYNTCFVCLFKGVGTAGQDPTLTIEQATDNAGTSAKAVPFAKIYSKSAATNLQGTGTFTEAANTAAGITAGTYTEASVANKAALWVVPVGLSLLDQAGGFKFIRGRVADVGANAQLGCLFYIMDVKERKRGHSHTTVLS